MLGNHYTLQEDEHELKEVERDLAAYLNVPFVKCEYDAVNSHKYQDKHEVKYREICAKETECWDACDYIINYELYKTKEDYNENGGGAKTFFKKVKESGMKDAYVVANDITTCRR